MIANPIEEVKKLGYRVRYVNHEVIKDYNACYNVIYDGKVIKPRAAEILGIPINEIWISEKWKKYEKYILYHELAEIKYRAAGYNQEEAHILSELECITLWRNDPMWREFIVELHISDIENMASEVVEEKIREILNILQRDLDYRCSGISFRELYEYLLGETPTGDVISLGDILRNRYYLIHEVVEICELKKQGVSIDRRTVIEHYSDVYKAHIKALDIELSYAYINNDIEWINSRIDTVAKQLDYDIELLSRYSDTRTVNELKKEIHNLLKKYQVTKTGYRH